jgi:DNA-binding NtrC family response regulator
MAKSVLIIDDEKDLCEVISRALKKEGFEVDCAYDLAEASKKLTEHPNIVILDNNLPDGTGLEYLQMHPEAFDHSFVILISASPDITVQKDATVVSITKFLTKPFSVNKIKELVMSAYK